MSLRDAIIIAYFDGDEDYKILSNFAVTPFKLDGVTYQTVEAFWQCLKVPDSELRAKVAALPDGITAKSVSKLIPSAAQHFEYEGNIYKVGSEAHHKLLERAIRAKVEQNIEVRHALLLSGVRPLKHMLVNKFGGWRSGDSPALPAIVFERILTTIRTELHEGRFVPDMPLPKGLNDFTETD